jgi:hypothetical protein
MPIMPIMPIMLIMAMEWRLAAARSLPAASSGR